MQINPKTFIACFRVALPERFSTACSQASLLRQGYLAKHPRKGWLLAASFFVTAALVSLIASGQASPPSIPAITLATSPLFAATGGDKPAITLALSVEAPTVGAQYLAGVHAVTDDTYTNAKEYLGYYDAESCYTYNNAPTETPQTGQTTADYKRFDRSGPATSRMCTNAFSGNFLNWASSSAIDMLRLSLTGGDRYIDRPDLTILQRAVLPNGGVAGCMWNTEFFPAKQLQRDGGSANNYWGAIPAVMKTQAAGSDVWIANTLDRIYFGTQRGGNCGDTGTYTLGVATPTSNLGPVTQVSGDRPADTESCAPQGGICNFSGTREVWYGAPGGWKVVPAANTAPCDHNVLGDPLFGVAKACYSRPYTGPWAPASNSASLSTDSFFYSRVQVCETSAGALQDNRDYGLCTQYPNGNYKPVGAIQKYGEQMRLAAFGYLMDSGSRVGGVLRAPMKYVGAKTFNTNGVDNTATGGNPNAEWNANTGVFVSNPDGDTTQAPGISGVINYVNKFGRTGPVPGRYKSFDPVGELHYEALRYLQGLQPTREAVALPLTTEMLDGFPIVTTWTDPYGGDRLRTADYSCLKSNIVTIGDIETWDGNRSGSRLPTPNEANNILNIGYWRSVVQAFEKNEVRTYLDGKGVGRSTGNPNAPNHNVASTSYASQVLGTSYWANTHDIRGTTWTNETAKQRPGLRVKSFFFDVDAYGRASDETDRRYKNQFFTAAKYGGFETDPSNIGGKPYNTYGNPFQRQDGTTDNNVWQDPSTPGEASTYYRQSDGRAVLRAFDNIFSRVLSSARSIAGSATSSKNITQAGSTIYQAAFDTTDWSGDVLSLPLTVDSNNVASVGTQPNWSAAERLSTRATPATSRNIVVGKAGATADPVALSFTWSEIRGTPLETHLAKITPSSTADALAEDRLNYLRGDRSKETGIFRKRTKLLGDIVNSGIVYSGAPTGNVGPSSTYPGFVTANASRTAAIFVGANDGMLHAFNASTGDELFGYIPSWMGPKLAALTRTDYNHRSYVDATPAVAEAQVGYAGDSTDWKTVLVSGTGAGGAGVFALDVTNPSAFSASKVMWEFTHADDPDLGYVVGRPKIVKLRTSAPNAATPTYRWFAMVASGVNNYVPDGTFGGIFSDTGKPALFLLALDKPAGAAWTATGASPNYYKISLPINATLSATMATGLINFQPVFGVAAEVTQVYMGDLHGNLWKLNFSSRGSTDWNMNKLSAYNKGTTASPLPYPLYIASTGGSTPVRQPISMAPSVVAGPMVGGVRTTYIAFATGKYLETADNTATGTNSLHVIHDNGSTAADSSPAAASVISGRGRLQSGSINATTGAVTVPAFIWGRAASDLDATQRSGWVVDFPETGERVVNSATVAGDNLIFGSLIPGSTAAAEPCPKAGGGGKAYVINIDTGQGNATASTVGLLGEPLVFEITSGATYATNATTGDLTKTDLRQVVQQGSSGVAASGAVRGNLRAARLSWRQINNYQYQKNAS
ncbi:MULTISPECIES: pilus assembly protein [unclassified Polaromonas]|uniref:pilus assembly protein n=1 Tax=unclassified Polaromonas TaxID=2638319 RepID=UPI000F086464|nr:MULTISPECIES: PilC/PilY family type IV pilus protein [unclassified Polaromonas]AYQ29008.1 pilus assembly protein PilY [Polaromonas sp. SP1]QGJ19873.1 pilus assembly protein PilY [Polaromonas sp. Pch-P]